MLQRWQDIYGKKERKTKEQIKTCAECETAEQSPVRADANGSEIDLLIFANCSAWVSPWAAVNCAGRGRSCAVGCIESCSRSYPANIKPAFVQLAASFGIKFMETSAKANINIENVSTVTFLFYLLSYLCKSAVRTLAHPAGCKTLFLDASDGLLCLYPCVLRRLCPTEWFCVALGA